MAALKDNPNLLLSVNGVKVHFPIKKGIFRKVTGHVKAVDGVDLHIRKGETLGLVGESGSGKTTLGRAIIRLVPHNAGQALFRAQDGSTVDLLRLEREELRQTRRQIQMIFQDPYSSLNARMRIQTILEEPLSIYHIGSLRERRDRIVEHLELTGLSASHVNRYPHEFSGGQRQRIGIARAIILNPSLIICDEAVSALDVSIQAQVLNLLERLKSRLHLSYLFIAHNLSVIYHISDRIAVMYLGKIVELANKRDLYRRPLHPYAEALLSAIPVADPKAVKEERILLPGEVADPSRPPPGCNFHPRCRHAEERCSREEVALEAADGADQRFVACHRYRELTLQAATYENRPLYRVNVAG